MTRLKPTALARHLRTVLNHNFPTTPFTVTSTSPSLLTSQSIIVVWHDGPSSAEVATTIAAYRGRTPSTTGAGYDSHDIRIDGETYRSDTEIRLHRLLSLTLLQEALDTIIAREHLRPEETPLVRSLNRDGSGGAALVFTASGNPQIRGNYLSDLIYQEAVKTSRIVRLIGDDCNQHHEKE